MTSFLLKFFIKDYKNTENQAVREKVGNFGGIVGIFCNLLLFIIKFIAGTISNSISITADAFNNLSDMGSSVVTLLGFKLSNIPPDKEHPFGHGRIEYLSATFVSAIIMFVGGELFLSSVKKIITPEPLETEKISISIIILVISVLIKLWMSFFNKKLGNMISSDSLKATAKDSLNDCISTSAVLISTFVSLFFNINIDAYAGLAVAIFIIYSGITSIKDTLNPLLGMPPKKEMIDEIENIVYSFDKFVGIHDLIVHNYGPGRTFASLHVEVPENINIIWCHEQIDLCEKIIRERMNIEVVIHMDPVATDDEFVNDLKSKVYKKIEEFDSSLSCHDFRVVKGEKVTNVIFDTVIPNKYKLSAEQLKIKIQELVHEISPNYNCVITIDIDYNSRI